MKEAKNEKRRQEKQKRKDDQAEKKAIKKTERDLVKAAKKPQKKPNSDQEQISKQKKGKIRIAMNLCNPFHLNDRWSEYSKEKTNSSTKLHTCSKSRIEILAPIDIANDIGLTFLDKRRGHRFHAEAALRRRTGRALVVRPSALASCRFRLRSCAYQKRA